MSYKGVSEAFLRGLPHLGSFLVQIILPCNIFFSFSFRLRKAMTSAGLSFRCHLGYLLYERGVSVLIPNMSPKGVRLFFKGVHASESKRGWKGPSDDDKLYIRETKGMLI